VPSIAELLAATGETTRRTPRRADDTAIIMYTLIEHGLDHPLGRAATRRLNQLHRRFAISNDDFRYVLGTFVFISARWVDRHGWRPLCCHERAAMFAFYTELGRRMNLADVPATYAEFEAFFDAYEAENFGYTPAAAELVTATKYLLADLPKPLVGAGQAVADALLDPPLRAATGTPDPPWWARAVLAGGLVGRAAWLRHAARPRERHSPAHGIRARTYPQGYDLATVGPAAETASSGPAADTASSGPAADTASSGPAAEAAQPAQPAQAAQPAEDEGRSAA
jgi:hypothetical protein